jgi:excisionase family DNA binding protein
MAEVMYHAPTGFMTLTQARAQLGVSKPTLRRLLKTHGVTVYEDPKDLRARLLKKDDVMALAARVAQPAAVDPEGKAAA